MDKKARQRQLFADGPIGVWVKMLGPRATRAVGIGMAVLLVVYAGSRVWLGH